MARGSVTKWQAIIIVGSVFAAFGGLIAWQGLIAPRIRHAEVDGVREIDTARGPMLLSSESVGRQITTVLARRTTIIDPKTLTLVVRSVASDADHYLGQSPSGGPLWFEPRYRGRSPTHFTARDPLTLEELTSSEAIAQKHPTELGSGIHEFSWDATHQAIYVLANDNHGWRVLGNYELERADKPAFDSLPDPRRSPSQRSAALELIKPKTVELHDGLTGKLLDVSDPAGELLSSRASLRSEANVLLTRTDASGALLWKHELAGQRSIIEAFRYDTRLLVVSHGADRGGNDWLTALDAARGTVLQQYQF
jgi:hypothetical protein